MFLLPPNANADPFAMSGMLDDGMAGDSETTPEMPMHFQGFSALHGMPPTGPSAAGSGGARLRVNKQAGARPAARRAAFAGTAAADRRAGVFVAESSMFADGVETADTAGLWSSWASKASPLTATAPPSRTDLLRPSRDRRDVAVTIQWRGGGTNVCLVGSFTNWTGRIPMIADGPCHYVTLHLRAGHHTFLFDVNGSLCVADEQPLVEGPEDGAPAHLVNTIEVDDGAEFEDAGDEASTEAVDECAWALFGAGAPSAALARARPNDGFSTHVPATVAWGPPPPLPPHLDELHGVAPRATCKTRAGLCPPPVWHVDLNHVGVVRSSGAPTEEDCADSVSPPSSPLLGPRSPPEASSPPSPARGVTLLEVTSRWRDARVTNVLYKPTAPRTHSPAGPAVTADSASAAIDIPMRHAEVARNALRELRVPRAPHAQLCLVHPPPITAASRAASNHSDVSMGVSGAADEHAWSLGETMESDRVEADVPAWSAGMRGALGGPAARHALVFR